jgi:hypothetical protein
MMPIWQNLWFRFSGFHLGRNESERGRCSDLPLINLERGSDDTSVRQDKTKEAIHDHDEGDQGTKAAYCLHPGSLVKPLDDLKKGLGFRV